MTKWMVSVVVAFLGLTGSVVAAPSFSCAGKLSAVETAICADPALGDADAQLAQRYRTVLNAAGAEEKTVIARAQRAWLKARNVACSGADLTGCLLGQYQQQLAQLSEGEHSAAAGTASSAQLKPGEQVFFNYVLMSCKADAVQLDFVDPALPLSVVAKTLEGQGLLGTAWAECTLASGKAVRVKAGNGSVAQAYGRCGASPETLVSVWLDRRKVVSGLAYEETCSEALLKSMTIGAASAEYCLLPAAAESALLENAPGVAAGEGCRRISFKADAAVDVQEYPDSKTGPVAAVGSLQLVSSQPQVKALCEGIVAVNKAYPLVVPGDVQQPAWTEVPEVEGEASWASAGSVFRAEFDLDNSGKVGTIYRHEQTNHAFDGTALARDKPGILTTEFDAHDPEGSLAKGVLVFVYQHATALLHGGATYLLLDPVNVKNDIVVVKPVVGGVEEVCVMRRVGENF